MHAPIPLQRMRPVALLVLTFTAFALAVTGTIVVELGALSILPLLLIVFALRSDFARMLLRFRERR